MVVWLPGPVPPTYNIPRERVEAGEVGVVCMGWAVVSEVRMMSRQVMVA